MTGETDLTFICGVLRRHLNPARHKAFVFGSRAGGKAARFSDYDIGLEGERLPSTDYFELLADFEESDFP